MASGWAYVGCADFATGSGPTGSVQYKEAGTMITGSDHLIFYTASHGAHPPMSLILSGNMSITGTLSASVINYENITVIDATGSTYFGNTSDDIHDRTGSLRVSTTTLAAAGRTIFWATASAEGVSPHVPRVGIGTTAPGEIVDVSVTGENGGIRVINDTDNAYLKLDAPSDEAAYVDFSTGESNDWQIGRRPNSNDLTVYDNDSGAGYIFTWQQGGNVGIGTTSPSALLHTSGSTGVLLQIDATSGSVPSANAPILFVTGGAIGRVGVGTAAPSETLSVAGTVSGSSTLQAVGVTTLGSTLNVSGNTGIGTDATDGILLHVSGNQGVGNGGALFQIDSLSGSVPAANAPILYVSGGGNGFVGLGTTTPTSQLHIKEGTGAGATAHASYDNVVIEGSTSPVGMSIMAPAAGWSALAFGDPNDSVNGLIAYSHLSKYLQIGTGEADAYMTFMAGDNSEALRIESGLRVSASAGFHANGAATFGSSVFATGSISGSSTLQIVGDADFGDRLNVTGAISGSDSLEVVGEAIVGATLTVSGNVGINTQPSNNILLHVSGTTYAGNDGALLQIDSASGSVPATNLPILYVSGGGNGYIGLGTTTPAAALDIRGTVQVGVNDVGHNVKFFGATAGQYMLWNEATDELVLAGDTKLSFHDGAGDENIIATSDGHLEVNAGTTLDITAPTVDINAATAVTIDGPAVTIADSTSNKPLVIIKNTTNDANSAVLRFVHDRGGAGVDADDIGLIEFYGDNAAQEQILFAKILAEVAEADDAAEGGRLILGVASHDGEMNNGLILTDGNVEDEVDVTVGNGTASIITIPGHIDLAGDIDVDGTANLDNTDIDGTFTMDGTAFDVNATATCLIDNSNTSNGVAINTVTSGGPVTIGHATSETTVSDNLTVTGDLSANGDTTTFASANANDPLVIIKNTTDDTDGAILRFIKDKGSAGAANDVNGLIQFYGDDANQDNIKFSEIKSQVKVHTNGSEGGKFTVSVAEHDGTSTAGFVIEDGNADGELDVTIGAGNASLTTISGMLKAVANVAIGGDVIGNCALHVSGTQYISNEDALFRIDTFSGSVPTANLPILYVSGGGNGYIGLGTTTPDAALDIRGHVHFGADTAGQDVRFYSATTNEGLLYDASEDELGLLLTTKLKFHDIGGGEEIFASSNGHLEVNAGTTLDITAPTVDINASTAVTIDGPSVLIANNATNTPVVEIRNAHNGGTAGILKFNNTEGGTAGTNGDILGTIEFWGTNNNGDGETIQYAEVHSQIADTTDGAEGGKLTFEVASHDGELAAGLILTDGSLEDEVDVTIANGAASVTAVSGLLTTVGSITPTTDNAVDLGAVDKRWANIYTGDLHLANDRGDWTVIEEENYLTIRSNKTGKRFKLLMEEIED